MRWISGKIVCYRTFNQLMRRTYGNALEADTRKLRTFTGGFRNRRSKSPSQAGNRHPGFDICRLRMPGLEFSRVTPLPRILVLGPSERPTWHKPTPADLVLLRVALLLRTRQALALSEDRTPQKIMRGKMEQLHELALICDPGK